MSTETLKEDITSYIITVARAGVPVTMEHIFAHVHLEHNITWEDFVKFLDDMDGRGEINIGIDPMKISFTRYQGFTYYVGLPQ